MVVAQQLLQCYFKLPIEGTSPTPRGTTFLTVYAIHVSCKLLLNTLDLHYRVYLLIVSLYFIYYIYTRILCVRVCVCVHVCMCYTTQPVCEWVTASLLY